MNSYPSGSNGMAFDARVLASITNPLHCQSIVPQSDMGDVIYEWMDSQVEKLSSAHLAEILRWADCCNFVDSCFMKAAKQELLSRGCYELSLGWDLSLKWEISLDWRRAGR